MGPKNKHEWAVVSAANRRHGIRDDAQKRGEKQGKWVMVVCSITSLLLGQQANCRLSLGSVDMLPKVMLSEGECERGILVE